MDQDKIWGYFQSEGLKKFSLSLPRLSYLLKQARRMRNPVRLRTLNIGIGDGWLEQKCQEQGWESFSLDPDEAAIVRLRRKGVEGRVGHLKSIPYDDNFFDVVFCSEVIEHLSFDEAKQGLSEIVRVLKRSGVLLGTVPYRENLFAGRVVCPACGEVFHRIGHQQAFDLDTLPKLFPQTLKMEELRATYFCDWKSLNWKGRVVALLKRALLFAGVHGENENIYFAARKLS